MGFFTRLLDAFKKPAAPPAPARIDRIAKERQALADVAAQQARQREEERQAELRNRIGGRLGQIQREQERSNEKIRMDRAALEVERRSKEEAQRRTDPVFMFTHRGQIVTGFRSSNVTSIQYDITRSILQVGYKDGSLYDYFGVPVQFAKSMLQSLSKGTWVWDNLRIRGTKLGHRFRYQMAQGPMRAGQQKKRNYEKSGTPGYLQHFGKVTAQSKAKGTQYPFQRVYPVGNQRKP